MIVSNCFSKALGGVLQSSLNIYRNNTREIIQRGLPGTTPFVAIALIDIAVSIVYKETECLQYIWSGFIYDLTFLSDGINGKYLHSNNI